MDFNNIKEQMEHDASQIIEGVNLSVLLRGQEVRTKAEREQIRTLLLSGNFYLEPCYLAWNYPISESTLFNIRNQRTK